MNISSEEMMNKITQELKGSSQKLKCDEETERKQLLNIKKGEHGIIDISEKLRDVLSPPRYSPYSNATPPSTRPVTAGKKLAASSKKKIADCIRDFLGEEEKQILPKFVKYDL